MSENRFSESQLKKAIGEELSAAGVVFQREPYLHGIQVDFVAVPSPERIVGFEVKNWPTNPRDLKRALNQVALIKAVAGLTEVYLVLPNFTADQRYPGVIGLADIKNALGTVKLRRDAEDRVPFMMGVDPSRVPDQSVFAAMPFAEEYDDVYFVAMSYAAEKVGAVIRRTDQEPFEGDVVSKIHDLIRKSSAVIADLSGVRPNVLYEIGYAHALGRPTIPICSSPVEELPFDIRNWNVLSYTKGRTYELRDRLARRVEAAIQSE